MLRPGRIFSTAEQGMPRVTLAKSTPFLPTVGWVNMLRQMLGPDSVVKKEKNRAWALTRQSRTKMPVPDQGLRLLGAALFDAGWYLPSSY